MDYKQIGDLNIKEASDLEIQIAPAGPLFVLQIASPFMRGTIVLDKNYERDDLMEVAEIICNMLEDLTINVDENAPPL